MNFKRIFLRCLLFYYCINNATFSHQWQLMQTEYKQLIKKLEQQHLSNLENTYYHPYWQEQKKLLNTILLGTPDHNCWRRNPISGSMVCAGYSHYQQYELDYLQSCLSEKTAAQIFSYRDTQFPGLSFECKELNCSSNTLVHLYYTAHILEKAPHPNHIVEFGGGYGNLARIFKHINPKATIVIIDLPELIALQYLFLSTTLDNTPIYIHATTPKEYIQGAIHLIPIHLLDTLSLTTDLFVSTFALSETPTIVQKKIIEKKFFGATSIYMTGQIDGWYPCSQFENHQLLQHAIRNVYSHVSTNLFHRSFNSTLKSYEIIAFNNTGPSGGN